MGQFDESQFPAKPDNTNSEPAQGVSGQQGNVSGQRDTEKVDRPLFTDWASI